MVPAKPNGHVLYHCFSMLICFKERNKCLLWYFLALSSASSTTSRLLENRSMPTLLNRTVRQYSQVTVTQNMVKSRINDYENQKIWLVKAYESISRPEKMTGSGKACLCRSSNIFGPNLGIDSISYSRVKLPTSLDCQGWFHSCSWSPARSCLCVEGTHCLSWCQHKPSRSPQGR